MRTLFLTHRLPYAPNRGDRIRAFHLLQAIASFSDVDLVSLVHDREEASHIGDLAQLAHVSCVPISRRRNFLLSVPSLLGNRPLTHVLLDSPALQPTLERALARQPDVVLAYCTGMARFALTRSLARLPFVLDMVDVDSYKWASLADAAPWPLRPVYRREARTLRVFEALATRRAWVTLVVNDRERDALQGIVPGGTIAVVPNGIDVSAFQRPWEGLSGRDRGMVVFCGVMDYPPNEQAVLWFGRRVWPLIIRQCPDACFLIVGSNPTSALRTLAAELPNIQVTGSVARVQPFLWRATVSVAPLQVARGIQNKVLEALAAGLPVVTTPTVMEGLPAEVWPACAVGHDVQDFARSVLRFLKMTQCQRDAIVAQIDFTQLGWKRRLDPIREILSGVARNQSTQLQRPGDDVVRGKPDDLWRAAAPQGEDAMRYIPPYART